VAKVVETGLEQGAPHLEIYRGERDRFLGAFPVVLPVDLAPREISGVLNRVGGGGLKLSIRK
jgi:hypothetical protein